MNSLISPIPPDLQSLHLLFYGKTTFLPHKKLWAKEAEQGKLTNRKVNATEMAEVALSAMVNCTLKYQKRKLICDFSPVQKNIVI